MAKKALPCPTVLRQLLRYEPETGKLFWKERAAHWFKESDTVSIETRCRIWNTRYAGNRAFTRSGDNGYHRGQVFKKDTYAHRVAWTIHHGAWPENDIDHINGVRTDNRISNLRDVTRSVNLQNQRVNARSTSGFTGVSWCKRRSIWRSRIFVGGKEVTLGTFAKIEDAVMARAQADKKYGFHENHGRE